MRRAALLALMAAVSCGEREPAEPEAYAQRLDPRVASLFHDCAKSDFYDRPLFDVVPILVEKLERGASDPMKRAKEELAALGPEAIPELRRFVERHYAEPLDIPFLSNALDVLKLNPAPEARGIVLRCLEHPSDTVRHAAVQALQLTHARPEDFDVLHALLDVEVHERRHQIAIALHAADPGRAEELYLDWIQRDQRRGLHRFVAPLLAGSTRPETARRAGELFLGAGEEVRASVAAPAARAGDAAALLHLERTLDPSADAGAELRTNAIAAALEAGLAPLAAEALANDPLARVRGVAAGGLAALEGELSEPALAALRSGLDDVDPSVRSACLDALVARGDRVATDRALALLDGTAASLQEGMSALRPRLASDEALAARVFERLRARNEIEAFLPPGKRTGVLKSIGQVPGEEPARLLRELGLAHPDQTVERLPAHEWSTIQAANTGDAGRGYLLLELASERDPRRRLDLLWAGTAARTDATRERLLTLLDDPSLSPEELLLVCDRLARIGPAAEIAPRLKRVPPRVSDLEVKVALQCLLWRWY